MRWRDTAEEAAFRSEVREFIAAECVPHSGLLTTDPLRDVFAIETSREWVAALASKRWLAPAWPREYGGGGLSVVDQYILSSELAEARAPRAFGVSVSFVGPTIIVHGTEEQKTRHLPAILTGEQRWAQGFSEPSAGSDLASLQTTAIRDGDEFIVNGQKVWTSGIHFADWMILLARTDSEAPKHKGISFFLVDVKSPGISHRPLVNIAGSHEFNEVFFDNVRVPASNLVGELNRGWYVAQTTLSFERSNVGNAIGQRQMVEDLAFIVRGGSGLPPGAVNLDTGPRHELAERWIEAGVATLMAQNIISLQASGIDDLGSEAAAAKMFSMELNQRIYRTANRLLGPWCQVLPNSGNGHAPFDGRLPLTFLRSAANTIEGGTSEVQRNIIAVRRLGLPR